MTKTISCSGCGTPVSIPAKYARASRATCLKCSDTGATPYGEKFAEVFKAGWYADHLKAIAKKKTQSIQWGQWIQLLVLPLLFLYFVFNPAPPEPGSLCTDFGDIVLCDK